MIPVDLADPTGTQETVAGALQANPVEGILTLGPTGATPTLAALTDSGQLGSIAFATFDMSPEVLEAIASTERDVPDYLSVNFDKLTCTYVRGPSFANQDVPYPVHMEPNLVIEYYSR